MTESGTFPWGQLSAVAAGMVALAVAARGIEAAFRLATKELDYRVGHLDTWFKGSR